MALTTRDWARERSRPARDLEVERTPHRTTTGVRLTTASHLDCGLRHLWELFAVPSSATLTLGEK
jgi:hypothetical protein